jgi:hypothetical protein
LYFGVSNIFLSLPTIPLSCICFINFWTWASLSASKRAKKEPIGKEAERLAQVQKFMKQMQDKGIVGKDKKILDTPKYKEEFAKFKAGLKNKF